MGRKNPHTQQSYSADFKSQLLKVINVVRCLLNFYDTMQDFPNVFAHKSLTGGMMQIIIFWNIL